MALSKQELDVALSGEKSSEITPSTVIAVPPLPVDYNIEKNHQTSGFENVIRAKEEGIEFTKNASPVVENVNRSLNPDETTLGVSGVEKKNPVDERKPVAHEEVSNKLTIQVEHASKSEPENVQNLLDALRERSRQQQRLAGQDDECRTSGASTDGPPPIHIHRRFPEGHGPAEIGDYLTATAPETPLPSPRSFTPPLSKEKVIYSFDSPMKS